LVIFYSIVQLLLQVFMAHHGVIRLPGILQNQSADESQNFLLSIATAYIATSFNCKLAFFITICTLL